MSDAWFINPHTTIDTIRRQLVFYLEELEDHGLPMPGEPPALKEIFCAKDRATALKMAIPYLLGKYRDYAKWGQDNAIPNNESFNKELDELIQGRFILGSIEDCYKELKPYWEKMGINQFIYRTQWAGMPLSTTLQSMRLISNELLPELRKV